MTRADGAETRRQRIAEIARIIHAALYASKEGWVPLARSVTTIMIRTGLTKNTVMDILKLLDADDQFELDEKNDRIKKHQEDAGV
jgi:hypothetical protein